MRIRGQQANFRTNGGCSIYQAASLYKFDLQFYCRSPGSGTMSTKPKSHSSPASYAHQNARLVYNPGSLLAYIYMFATQ